MESLSSEKLRVTDRARAATGAAGLDPSRTFVVQHVLGCGGSGCRLVFRETPRDGAGIVDGPEGFRVSLESSPLRRLEGAALDYDHEKETEGFWLDHPDAAFAAFC